MVRSRCESARKASAWLRWRPKPLTIRMPSTLSSTTVVRSPTWSWAFRATSEYFVSNTEHRTISGTAGASSTRPSDQSWANRMTKPTRIVAALTTRKVSGNARNIRSSIRSVVPRDSSWPEGERSWKATGSRCRWR
ncbi:hypothetical protein SMICM304S_06108 [Streptomyces microflavus]